MPFKVVATPFGRQIETEFPYEHEALRPLGITISTVDAESDADYVATVKDADAIIAGGRRLTAEIISRARRLSGRSRQPRDDAAAVLHQKDGAARSLCA